MTQALGPSKIVIVEDNEALAEIYKTRLELLGYECTVALDGIDALAVIEKIRPNLVLLDIMLPKLSGDWMLKALRSTNWGKQIPVMVISNLNEKDVPINLRDLGIKGYYVKANLLDGQIDLLVGNALNPASESPPDSRKETETVDLSQVHSLPEEVA